MASNDSGVTEDSSTLSSVGEMEEEVESLISSELGELGDVEEVTMFTPAPVDLLHFRPKLSGYTMSLLIQFQKNRKRKPNSSSTPAPASETTDLSFGWFNYYKLLHTALKFLSTCTHHQQHTRLNEDVCLLVVERHRALSWLVDFASQVLLTEKEDADLARRMWDQAGFVPFQFVIPVQLDPEVAEKLCTSLFDAYVPFRFG